MGHRCDNCGGWVANDDFELCYDCNQAEREERNEPVLVRHHGVVAETDLAIRIKTGPSAFDEGVWIPKSQIEDDDREKGEVWIPRWLAKDKGLRATG